MVPVQPFGLLRDGILMTHRGLSFASALCYDRGGKSNKRMLDSNPFDGIAIGVFETRRQREFSAMFVARGAQVVSCPLIFPESHGVKESVRKFIEDALQGKFAAVIFYTGIGILTVLDAAQQLGKYDVLRDALLHMTMIARGPKG